ncbi:hypothetical protein [Candidatus Enterococcus leclercqii]|uniref:hypothetical protein n=1 Tax=Candidatus Enterococcus leclercqii TaxID=1857218 RepID=UPI00137B900D|nr:hypothetical protein [Enterococcus sp. CU9D]KAF1294149.1 hypothetical protein BAU14_07105 [Enterococcus sp. CU9D]
MYPLKTKELDGVKDVYLNTLRKIEPPHIYEMSIIEWHSVNPSQLVKAVRALVNSYPEYQKDILEIGDSRIFERSKFLPFNLFRCEMTVQEQSRQIQTSDCQLLLVQFSESMSLAMIERLVTLATTGNHPKVVLFLTVENRARILPALSFSHIAYQSIWDIWNQLEWQETDPYLVERLYQLIRFTYLS